MSALVKQSVKDKKLGLSVDQVTMLKAIIVIMPLDRICILEPLQMLMMPVLIRKSGLIFIIPTATNL